MSEMASTGNGIPFSTNNINGLSSPGTPSGIKHTSKIEVPLAMSIGATSSQSKPSNPTDTAAASLVIAEAGTVDYDAGTIVNGSFDILYQYDHDIFTP